MSIDVRRLENLGPADIAQLSDVLIDCVDGGASVSFMWPLGVETARAFWLRVADDVAADKRILLVASDEDGIVGTVQLVLDMPDNQPHRADLAKMLVHRRGRGRGIGASLLLAAEAAARFARRSLLVLDTVSGSAGERLYQRHGWVRVGEIPDFALWPRGGACPTTYYYRRLN